MADIFLPPGGNRSKLCPACGKDKRRPIHHQCGEIMRSRRGVPAFPLNKPAKKGPMR